MSEKRAFTANWAIEEFLIDIMCNSSFSDLHRFLAVSKQSTASLSLPL